MIPSCSSNTAQGHRCSVDFEMSNVAPSLSSFHRNIELRVNAGVRNVAACIEKVENKDRILRHVRNLVLHVTGALPSGPRSHPFARPLEKLIFSKPYPSSTPTSLGQAKQGISHQTLPAPSWLKLDSMRESSPNHNFARLVSSDYGLDPSKNFAVILAQLELLCQPKSPLTSSREQTAMRLLVTFDKAVPTVWELNAAQGLQEGDNIWLAARSPLMSMALVPSIGDLRLSVKAALHDGRSQHLGDFSMSSILTLIVDLDRALKTATRFSFPFLRHVNFIVEGRRTQSLELCADKSKSAVSTFGSLQTRGNLGLLSVTVGCATELAMSVAQLTTGTEDNVDIRGRKHITPLSLSSIDDLLLSLKAESIATRELAARRDAFGYTLADIRQIMEMQLDADDNLGAMEESHIGSWN